MKVRAFGILACALWGAGAMAQEFVVSEGALSDTDFYRLVACAAPPGKACRKPFVRWAADRPLRVSIERIDPAFLGGKTKRAKAALQRAMQRIDEASAGLALVRVPEGQNADIRILFLDIPAGGKVTGSGIEGLDGQVLGGASTRVWYSAAARAGEDTGIRRATIVFSRTLSMRSYESAMLEELTQALGLMTDIRNPWYNARSIFSEDSNARKDLGVQDIMVLQRHYPPR